MSYNILKTATWNFAKCAIFVMAIVSLNISCDDSEEEAESGEWAPASLEIGKYVNWWGTYFENGKEYSETEDFRPFSIQIINEKQQQPSWTRSWGTYTYTKTGENTAKLSFSAYQSVSGISRSFQYNATLTFTSKNCFEMKGSKYVSSSMGGSAYCTLNCHGIISDKHSSEGYKEP